MLLTLHSSLSFSVHFLCLCLSVSVCCCVLLRVGVCGVCGVCCVWRVGTQKKTPCVDSKVPVCTGTTRTRVTTCGRAGTHGDVLNVHTVFFLDGHTVGRGREGGRREKGGGHRQWLLTEICTLGYHVHQRGSPKETLGSDPFSV